MQDLLAPSSIASLADPLNISSGTLFVCLGGLVLKRALDILAASILLTVSLPVLAVAGVLIRIDSPGPAIFRQARMGRRFRRFQLYKLRTMTTGGTGPAYTLGADPRITPIGQWLRRFKIDELPQLWNVLCGDMSIVGPRPVIPELAVEFNVAYRGLLAVRPGLTDPASLKYCRETEILSQVDNPYRYFKTVVTPDKIRISQGYLERATVWSDTLIVIRTVLALTVPPLLHGLTGRQLGQPPVEKAIPPLIGLPEIVTDRAPLPTRLPPPIMLHFHVPPGMIEKSRPPAVRGGDSLRA